MLSYKYTIEGVSICIKLYFIKIINGRSEIYEYIQKMSNNKNKSKTDKIKFTKIISYIDLLARNGLNLKEPYVKHIEGDLWELRPLRDRILFTYYENNKIVMLNYFMKTTNKTPQKEIEKAKRLLKEYKSRSDENE